MAVNEAERAKKLREALFIMLGADAIAFLLFWLVQAYLHQPNLAFSLLVVGLMIGAAYYVYQSHKLRPKE
jgi:hypothetical protein